MTDVPPSSPRVSVALCVYNGERHLREQLETVLAQRDVDLEVIAVDDGSSDGSVALLREAAARDPRLSVFANPSNLGHLRSFERAMSLCRGDYIAPCDQDDIWHPQKLSRLVATIGDNDLAYCDSEYIDEQGRSLGRGISDDLPMHAGRDPLRYMFQNTVSGHACLLKRGLLAKAGPSPELLYHDWWLAMCAAAHDGVAYLDEPLVRFRRHVEAYSPLGKKTAKARKSKQERRRDALTTSLNRKWLEERTYLAKALAATGWRGSAEARDWDRALLAAAEDQPEALWRVIRRDRHSIPPWKGLAWINALQFYKRCKRKIRRAKREPPNTTKLFRA